MALNVLNELRKIGHAYPARAEPIPVCLDGVGMIGHLENRRGLYINSALEHHVKLLMRDQMRAERAARDISNGRFGADEILHLASLGSDRRDAMRAIKSMSAVLASWDNVRDAKDLGKHKELMGEKVAGFTATASTWCSLLAATGYPAAMTYPAIPGAAAKSNLDAGSLLCGCPAIGAADDLYLNNIGVNCTNGTNIMLAVDILTANGSIAGTLVTSQTVNSVAIPRWTGGAGVMMTLEVTTAMGTATGIPTVTVNYTDESGNAASSTGAISIGVTSAGVGALLPRQDGPLIRLASGDYGVRSIQQVTFSGSSAGAGAAVAALQYKPLIAFPTISTINFVERSTPAQVYNIRKLTTTVGGSMPFVGFFILPNASVPVPIAWLCDVVWG